MNCQSEITLNYNDKTITNKDDVAQIFNNYYVNITADIGTSSRINSSDCVNDIISDRYENRNSIHNMRRHMNSIKGKF